MKKLLYRLGEWSIFTWILIAITLENLAIYLGWLK